MRQIFKNYLATFIKNWLQTIGTVLFILMMFAVVIGFLAAPLQIYAHVKSMDNKNNHYTQVVKDKDFMYNSEFLYKFLYEGNETYYQTLSQGKDAGTQKEVLTKAGLNSDGEDQLLSDVFKHAVDLDAGSTDYKTDNDKYDGYASYIRNGVNAFTNGALVKTSAFFPLYLDDKSGSKQEQTLLSDFKDNVQSLISTIYQIEPGASLDGAMQSRGFAIINNILSAGSFSKTATDLAQYMAGADNSFIKIDDGRNIDGSSENNGPLFNKADGTISLQTAKEPWEDAPEKLIVGYGDKVQTKTAGGNASVNPKPVFTNKNILINGEELDDQSIVNAKAGATKIIIKLSADQLKKVTDAMNDSKNPTSPTISMSNFRNGNEEISLNETDKKIDLPNPSGDIPVTVDAQPNQQFGNSIVNLMRMDMADRGATSQKLYLIASQVFNSSQEPVDPNDPTKFKGSSFFEKLTLGEYSYNFLNYITRATLNDINNENAFNAAKQEFNYKFNIENSIYVSQTTSSSLFPSLSMELRTVNDPNDTNQLQLAEGRRPEAFNIGYEDRQDTLDDVMSGKIVPEIVLNSAYAKNNKIKIGDLITLPDGPEHNNVSSLVGNKSSDDFLTSNIKYKVVGIGEKFDDAVPGEHYVPFMEDIKTYANAYVDDGWFNILKEAKWFNSSNEAWNYESNIRVTNNKGAKVDPVNAFNFNFKDKNSNNGLYDTTNLPFVNYKNTTTMTSVNETKIKVIIFIILGIAVLVLAFIFINFIITKELNETRRQIGIFKSFGYKISELSWIFAIKTFLTIFVGAVLGWVVSIAIQTWSAGNYLSSVMFSFNKIYGSAVFLVILFIVIPAIFLLVSYVMTLFYLREPTLSLLSNGAKVKKGTTHVGPLIKHLAKVGKGFGYRLQQGFVRDSMGKFVVVQILFAIASLTFTLMFGAQDLMYSVADQGFSVLQKEANHRYSWANQDGINIGYNAKTDTANGETGPRYSLTDQTTFEQRKFKYISYKGNEKIGDVLNSDATMSDSRYRENYLISSISNTFDVNKTDAMELLMPLDYFLVKNAGVKPEDLPNVVNNLPGATDLQKKAAEQDKDIPALMIGQEMAYHDYYLNWILSFRINAMPQDDVDKIKSALINRTTKYDLSTLIQYVNDWKGDLKSNPIKIDMGQIITDPRQVQKLFADTLFGLSDTNGDKKNNLFLSDITKIITLELAENYAETNYNNYLTDYSPVKIAKDGTKIYSTSDTVKALRRSKNDNIWKDFSPNNKKYWGMQNNPLMGSMLSGTSGAKSGAASGSSGLSLSKMNGQTISLIMAAAMLGFNSDDIQTMPTITINEAFFNQDTESLFYNVPITGVDDSQAGRNALTLFDYRDNKYGTYNRSLTHENVSDDTYKKLATDTGDKNSVYAVVPYGLAKYRKIKVGDTFKVNTDTKNKRTIDLKVIGINKSVAYSLGGGWSIDVDYNQFANKFFDSTLKSYVDDEGQNLPLFNSWVSNEPMLEGSINLDDIPGSINKMKFVGKNLSMSIAPGASVFGSIFNGMVDFSTLLGSKVDPSYRLITNPNVASTSSLSSVLPFNILRAGVNNGISEINNILIVFMVLVAVMLLIILVVVMNIIVEQATPIILTLKSLGYNQREINWITMGSYITGAVISFIVAYCVSLAIWNIFLAVAGSLWHIYVFMSYSWKAPVITFLVVGAILFIGWFVSDRKVEKIPLTLVTGFN